MALIQSCASRTTTVRSGTALRCTVSRCMMSLDNQAPNALLRAVCLSLEVYFLTWTRFMAACLWSAIWSALGSLLHLA
jgi:hypothetical protein